MMRWDIQAKKREAGESSEEAGVLPSAAVAIIVPDNNDAGGLPTLPPRSE